MSTFGHHYVFMQGASNKVTNTKVKHNRKVIITKNKNITSFIFLFLVNYCEMLGTLAKNLERDLD